MHLRCTVFALVGSNPTPSKSAPVAQLVRALCLCRKGRGFKSPREYSGGLINYLKMDNELETLNNEMKKEINDIKQKFKLLKKEVKDKYKQPSKRKSIPKVVKDTVWNTNFTEDKGSGKCFVCNKKITSRSFDCGHIVSVAHGGNDELDNLKPICSSCNKSMGTQNMIDFKNTYFKTKKTMNSQSFDDNLGSGKLFQTNTINGIHFG